MQYSNSVWPGYVSHWQSSFIRQNILIIGYIAWNDYLNAGRGMVVCEIIDALHPAIDWSLDLVAFRLAFIPRCRAANYLRRLDLEEDVVDALLETIETYDPMRAIVALVKGNGEVDCSLLQNLKISPVDCCEQVLRRWPEFQPGLILQGE